VVTLLGSLRQSFAEVGVVIVQKEPQVQVFVVFQPAEAIAKRLDRRWLRLHIG
jgi:hypothetical protein